MTLDREMRSALDAVNVDHLGERPIDYVRAMPDGPRSRPAGRARILGLAGFAASIAIAWRRA